MSGPVRARTYHAATAEQAAQLFEQDAAEIGASGFYPTSQAWQGTSLTVTYQRQDTIFSQAPASGAVSGGEQAEPRHDRTGPFPRESDWHVLIRPWLRSLASRVTRVPWFVWLIVGVAVVLRLAPVAYGLPQLLDSDEEVFVDAAWRMVADRTLDPGWYGHPASTSIDALAVLFALYGLVGVATGAYPSVSAALEQYWLDPTPFWLMGRGLMALTGAAVVLAAYALARELRVSVFWSSVAAALLALSSTFVLYSSVVRADMPLVLSVLLVLLMVTKAMTAPTARAFALAGVFLGLAVTSKYPGVIAALPIAGAALLLAIERRVTPRQAVTWTVLAAVASVVTAFLVAPYLFINFSDALDAVLVEARATHLSHTSEGFGPSLWAYLTEVLPEMLGFAAAALGLLGVVVMLASRTARWSALFFWLFLCFISGLALFWERWALPLAPVAAVGAVLVLDRAELGLRRMRMSRWLLPIQLAIAGILVVPLIPATASYVGSRMTNDDTRVVALEWIDSVLPAGSTLLVETYTPQVSSSRYEVLVTRAGAIEAWSEQSERLRPDGFFGSLGNGWRERDPGELIEAIEARGVDYVIISPDWVRRYRAEADAYAGELAAYEALLEAYPVIRSFERADASLGGPVAVLQVNAEPAPEGGVSRERPTTKQPATDS